MIEQGVALNTCPTASSIRHDNSTLNQQSKPRPRAGVRGLDVRQKNEKITRMKVRESGMPQEDTWENFFDARCILDRLVACGDSEGISVAEFGCGYGTFTIPLARITSGRVHAFDIEPELIQRLSERAKSERIDNIVPVLRDFVADGTGLPSESVDHAMLYNILHIEDPISLLAEAFRIVRSGGSISIIHWRSDIPTPRGPSLSIRPTPEQIHSWLAEVGFSEISGEELFCSCYHFGVRAIRGANPVSKNRKANKAVDSTRCRA